MTTDLVQDALQELLHADAEDHRRVSRAASFETPEAPAPLDPELAALAGELRRLRWFEPDAPVLALLGDAAADHADAVERHLAWLNDAPQSAVIRLIDEPRVMTHGVEVFQLAS